MYRNVTDVLLTYNLTNGTMWISFNPVGLLGGNFLGFCKLFSGVSISLERTLGLSVTYGMAYITVVTSGGGIENVDEEGKVDDGKDEGEEYVGAG